MSVAKVMKMLKDNGVKYVDLRFTDTIGKEQHVTIPASVVKADFFKAGKSDSADEPIKDYGFENSDKEKILQLEREIEDEMSMRDMDDPSSGIEMEIDLS